MTRAEEAALMAYPKETPLEVFGYSLEYSDTLAGRKGFIKGYEQAEKDLALTIDDIEKLHTFLYAVKNNKQGAFTFTRLSDEQYEEVLRRFNKTKEQ